MTHTPHPAESIHGRQPARLVVERRQQRARHLERDLNGDGAHLQGPVGRGPTKTRTQWAGPDILLVTLEQTFTPAELSLRRLGEHGRLRDLRLLFQYAETAAFCEPIERLTGRKVRAFVSGIDTAADLATEMFVLHPAGYDGPSRTMS
jgi:uncharacterized protein YbcI